MIFFYWVVKNNLSYRTIYRIVRTALSFGLEKDGGKGGLIRRVPIGAEQIFVILN